MTKIAVLLLAIGFQGARANLWDSAKGLVDKYTGGDDALKKCLEQKMTDAGVSRSQATEAQKKMWMEQCRQEETQQDPQKVLAKAMRLCVQAKAIAAGKLSTLAATEEERGTWRAECQSVAQQNFTAAGGKLEDMKAALSLGADKDSAARMAECVTNASQAAGVNLESATGQQVMQFQQACRQQAMEAFVSAGGGSDAGSFRDGIQKGAEFEGATKMMQCVEEKAASADKTTTEATAGEMMAWKVACRNVAMAAFGGSGGDVSDFIGGVQRGARAKGIQYMADCFGNVSQASSSDLSEEEVANLKRQCKTAAQQEFLAAGGDKMDFFDALEKGTGLRAAENMKACVLARAANASKDVNGATAEEAAQWRE
jgi:uncharacterized protein YjiS (DUF1127 family)